MNQEYPSSMDRLKHLQNAVDKQGLEIGQSGFVSGLRQLDDLGYGYCSNVHVFT